MEHRSRLDRRPGAANHYPSRFLDALAERLREVASARAQTLVAIDGWGCGGKTALAEGLLDRLEPGAVYLGIDEFFRTFPPEKLDELHPVAHLRWPEIEQALAGLRECGVADVRPFDWNASVVGPPERVSGRLVLVEGLFSLKRELADRYDFSIWVEGRLEGRMKRVAARDGAHMIPFWENEWIPRELAFFLQERPWERADLIVAGADLPLGEVGAQLRSR